MGCHGAIKGIFQTMKKGFGWLLPHWENTQVLMVCFRADGHMTHLMYNHTHATCMSEWVRWEGGDPQQGRPYGEQREFLRRHTDEKNFSLLPSNCRRLLPTAICYPPTALGQPPTADRRPPLPTPPSLSERCPYGHFRTGSHSKLALPLKTTHHRVSIRLQGENSRFR